jgi:hypothetical protein
MVARDGVEPPTPAFSGATEALLAVNYKDVEGCETPVTTRNNEDSGLERRAMFSCSSLLARTAMMPQTSTRGSTRRNLCHGQSFAINRRLRCGFIRGCPVLSSHFCPGPAPQVGHRMASTCFGLSCFLIKTSMPQKSDLLTSVGNLREAPYVTPESYPFVTTDMGRFCRNALMSALFICKPPL